MKFNSRVAEDFSGYLQIVDNSVSVCYGTQLYWQTAERLKQLMVLSRVNTVAMSMYRERRRLS